MANTFDASWIKYYRKGGAPHVVFGQNPGQALVDVSMQGTPVTCPLIATINAGADGLIVVPYWRYWATIKAFSRIRNYETKNPVIFYGTWEQQYADSPENYAIFTQHKNVPLPDQPDMQISEAEIQDYWDHRL